MKTRTTQNRTEQTTAARGVSAQPRPICLEVEGGEIFFVDRSPAAGFCSLLQRDTGADIRMPFLEMFP